MERYVDQEGYERLCNAVVVTAANDLRKALKKLKRNPDNMDALDMKRECEQFFRSQYFESFTEVDGEYLIRKLHEEVK